MSPTSRAKDRRPLADRLAELDTAPTGDQDTTAQEWNQASRPPVKVSEEEWWRFAQTIKSMLIDPRYFYAESTLSGILETVEKTKRVTFGQQNAIQKIDDNPRSSVNRYRRQWDRGSR